MLRIIHSKSASGLVEYFDAELSRGDYYSERGSQPGLWHGKAAERLGLSGEVQRDDFAALAHNLHPETKEQLTARMKNNRRPGYDFTFSAPKSVSVLYEHLMASGREGDAHALLEALKQSVRDAMGEVEDNLEVRNRSHGENSDRTAGNMAWAEFTHFQSRPVNGVADPHLHIHAYAFNLTWDDEAEPDDRRGIGGNSRGGWKAGQFGGVKRDAEYFQAFFDDRLATRLQAMGYATEREGLSFEIRGIAQEMREKFSERTAEIEKEAAKLAAADGGISITRKASIGARIRKNKETGLSPDENRALSHARLSGGERSALDALRGSFNAVLKPDEEAFAYAGEYWFERKSVASEKRYVAEALKASVGSGLSWRVKEAIAKVPGLVRGMSATGEAIVTTAQVQAEERFILSHIANGRGSKESFAERGKAKGQTGYRIADERLSEEQRALVRISLHNTDSVFGIMGDAGTGKSTALAEIVRAVHTTSGIASLVLAPTTTARDVLRNDGFEAETVAKLLADKTLRKKAKGGLIVIDEAGLMGAQEMANVFALAREAGARVLLIGDTKQGQSVARGDALRLVEEKGGVAFASLKTIRRQENAEYRAAVESLVRGDTAGGFAKLEAMGAVREVAGDAKRYAGIAESYAAKLERGHTVAIVAPTHDEIAKVTKAVRAKLASLGKLQHARETTALVATKLTAAERGSAHAYEAGQVIQFQRNAEGFRNGERATVESVKDGEVTVIRHGAKAERLKLDLGNAKAFEVYERRALELATGDLVRVTQGGKDASGKRLTRGALFEVRGFDAKGGLLLGAASAGTPSKGATRRLEASEALHLAHGYATTSHASQGLTRHHVIAAMASDSFAATSWEQFYVTLSRGKWSAEVWTDSADELREEVARSGRRAFALDVKEARKQPEKAAEQAKTRRFSAAIDAARAILQRRKRRTAAHDSAEASPTSEPRTRAEIEAKRARERGPSPGR